MRFATAPRPLAVAALAAVPVLATATPAAAAPAGESWDTIFTVARSGLCVGN
ncbi:hypothetical protein ACQPW1_03930 [Nocardia sp. CA-128927]|uniref:hypothetical protein n=1 Tax=Nocardia sp. CA-128927 TaxID=3239975 RepID=UPI003D9548DB